MISRKTLEERLAFRNKALEEARAAYLALLNGGVKSYSIGSRNLTKFDIPQLESTISRLEKEVSSLESQLDGTGRSRKAIGVVPRDW
ncbi:hypothetical protein BVG16_16400 [Paenibacillus selenitireducens]|uniref:Uncharacterized protein n=1 Tax=Paenibacillus selenitireducens TaxID=1324314 RepID=A0A1T2XA35_9BACL|nr:hypothetical protein [Paenibacillus selenitireducens]OPA76751.1 hypothetical protein BVG16_16400 [Paenibacillus selenitireducens]